MKAEEIVNDINTRSNRTLRLAAGAVAQPVAANRVAVPRRGLLREPPRLLRAEPRLLWVSLRWLPHITIGAVCRDSTGVVR